MKIVILGGGFCGAMVAKHLQSHKEFSVTLIDKKPYFEYIPSTLFCITHPNYEKKIKIPYKKFLPHTTILADTIQRVSEKTVTTTKQTIPFDYAVICTGSTYPIYLSNKKNVFTLHRISDAVTLFKKLSNASSVLIVGGGYIGVEAAGQLATQHKEVSITLVDVESTLLSRSPPQASVYATRFLKKHKLKIIHNQKVVDHPTPTTYILSDDTSIDADVCIWCAGIQVDTSFLDTTLSSCVNSVKRIQVNSFLQMKSHPHIFAGGDVCSVSEEKTAQHAEVHAKIIAKNIVSVSNNKPLKKYKKKRSAQLISLGEYSGILQLNDTAVYCRFFGVGKKLIEYYTFLKLLKKLP